jgi:hypothetical protein
MLAAWKMIGHGEDATDEDGGWGEVLQSATVKGANLAGVKAAVDRAGTSAIVA